MTQEDTDNALDEAAAELSLPRGATRAALRNFPLSLVLTDPKKADNPIVYVNRAFIETTGYTPKMVLGRNCRFLQGDDRDQEGVHALRDAIAKESEITVDLVNYRADGERFVNRLMVTPLTGPDGGIEFFLGVQTQHKGAKTHAEQAFDLTERLREFQHRVKNHLSLIISMIRLHGMEQGSAKEIVALLSTRVEALALLYDQVLNPDAAQNEQKVSLGAYLTEVCSTLQLMAEKKHIRVNVHADEITVPFEDGWRTGLLLSELLTNALQHAFDDEERGEIAVDITVEDKEFCLTVVDNGKGLGGVQWPNEGNLGGKIVRQLVERLSGTLDVHDRQDASGTRASLRVPLTTLS